MNTKLMIERDLNNIPDTQLRNREQQIKRIQMEFGYDRENAAKLCEYQEFQAKQMTFNCVVGAAAAYKFNPLQREAALSYPLFRKTWMKVPIRLGVFTFGYYVASQMQTRFFPKFSPKYYKSFEEHQVGVTPNIYLANHDLISKFRFFENGGASASAQNEVEQYLDFYHSGPLTKAEMLNRFAEGKFVDPAFQAKHKIRRMGKDKNDMFWTFGKIHGLENVALCDLDELMKTNGDPMQIQALVNQANDQAKLEGPGSFDQAVVELKDSLEKYRQAVDSIAEGKQFNPSDRKKMLAMPFYLSKRVELPEPKRGQKEYELFRQITGNEWCKYDDLQFDPEEKINEFNYERFIPKHMLKNIDTESDEFKQTIKWMNFATMTEYEKHKKAQDEFKRLMPTLTKLTEEETEIFIHLVKSKNRNMNTHAQRSMDLIDQACSNDLKTELAKISENENFAAKNRYMLDHERMKFADKKKMPVKASKVKDILRNQHVVRGKIEDEVTTYTQFQQNTQFENGILTYVNEAAYGDMRQLLKDVGISNKTIRFNNVSDLIKIKDQKIHDSDDQFENLQNARFTMVDMTEYEEIFSTPNEIKGDIPLHNISLLQPVMPEMWPQSNTLIEVNPIETLPLAATGKTYRENQEMRMAEPEEEEDEEDEDDDDEDEDEDEDEEEEEGDEEEEGEDYEEPEDPTEVPPDVMAHNFYEDKYFLHNESLRGKFNEVELDSFMKLLNIKAAPQWEDDTVHHHKVGLHVYEDESQMTDPYYHLLAEVERKHMEKQQVVNFRRGTEIKFVLDPKKRPVFSHKN